MGKSILIVEDEQNIVDILSFNLSREGYDTLEAYDGPTGLQLALEQDPEDRAMLDAFAGGLDLHQYLVSSWHRGGHVDHLQSGQITGFGKLQCFHIQPSGCCRDAPIYGRQAWCFCQWLLSAGQVQISAT